MADYLTGEEVEIDDKIFLATTRPPFGGLRWWFVCPHLNRRVRKLYLPLGGRHFWSRHAYELAYASQRETKFARALRRARKLRLRLGGDPTGDEYPDKPPRMRWATYNRLMDRLVAADDVTDERLLAARLLWNQTVQICIVSLPFTSRESSKARNRLPWPSSKYELVINLKTAKAIALTIPESHEL
jgi:hypothetical protein